MDAALALKALILGIVEGLTEFLPVSSTGHLIIAGSLLDFHDEKGKVFELVIQTGAMLAVCWEYRQRFLGVARGITHDPQAQRFIAHLFVAFLPAACIGLALGSIIKAHLFNPVAVAAALVLGGVVILWVERRPVVTVRLDDVDRMTWQDALRVGFAQACALIPGVSRSGATIIGGMLFGMSRRAATEFSFFLAVPTLVAAGGYDLIKNRALLSAEDIGLFLLGTVTAFASALVCIRWLIRFVSTHDFRPFAWYRIAFGLVILITSQTGWVDW